MVGIGADQPVAALPAVAQHVGGDEAFDLLLGGLLRDAERARKVGDRVLPIGVK